MPDVASNTGGQHQLSFGYRNGAVQNGAPCNNMEIDDVKVASYWTRCCAARPLAIGCS